MIRCLYKNVIDEEEGDQDHTVMKKVCVYVWCVCVHKQASKSDLYGFSY